ncbi:hypothetical protein NQ314_014099, partial [Rhamnusium bicolor]
HTSNDFSKFFDLTNPDDVFELNRIVFDSESEDEGSQNDSDEDDVIILDFKDDHPDEEEKSENEDQDPDEDEQSQNEDDFQSEDPLPPASDSEDDEPLAQIELADRDKENLDKITEYTNKEITIQRLNYAKNMNNSDTEDTSQPSYTKDTNNVEIQALFGLFYYAGVMKMSGVFTKELFDKDSGISIFRAKNARSTNTPRSMNNWLDFEGDALLNYYIPSEPDKYGIKIVMCFDAKTAFVLNAEIYIGKNSTPNDIPVAQYYCDKLTTYFQGTNRNLTMDNWFTSVQTAKNLLEKNYGLRILHYYHIVRQKLKKNCYYALDYGDEPYTTKLPEIKKFCNSTKGGVDTLDQLYHTYSTGRKTRRWPLCLFYNLLNIVGYNSLVLLRGSDAPDKEIISNRRAYLKKLSLDLVKPHMESRLEIPTLRRELRQTIYNVLKITSAEEVPIRPHTTR